MKPKFNRVEVIGREGRKLVHYGEVRTVVQDRGRTLKIFTDLCEHGNSSCEVGFKKPPRFFCTKHVKDRLKLKRSTT